jgi:hypothetical protein
MTLAMTDEARPYMPRELIPDSLITVILEQVAAGRSLVSVLESNEGYPGRTSWYRWVSEDPTLSARYVQAIQQQVARRSYATK